MSKIIDTLLDKIRTGEAGLVSLRSVFENATHEDLIDLAASEHDEETDSLITEAIEKAGLEYDHIKQLVQRAIASPDTRDTGTDPAGTDNGSTGSTTPSDSGSAEKNDNPHPENNGENNA